MRTLSMLLFAGWIMSGCGDPGTGPVEVHWDRDSCERCRMILSDRKHAAQIRYMDTSNRSRVRVFDDIGCAVIWLDEQLWRDSPTTEIWTIDHQTGEWIDARSAYYINGQLTPMEYGLGAQQQKPISVSLTFSEAKVHIYQVEKNYNLHGIHIEDRPERGERE